jgi:predicted permease
MRDLTADIRYAIRGLRQAPVFAAVAVLSLAFGIGANGAVFTLLDQVLLRSLPVARPHELVQVHARGTESYGGGMGDGTELSYAMYRDVRDHNAAFSTVFCRFPSSLHVGHAGSTEQVAGELVSGTFFRALDVGAAVGRVFTDEDDLTPGGHPVAVLAHRYWQARFGGDPSVVGRTLTVNGHSLDVIGVAQAGFDGIDLARPAMVYVPVSMQPRMGPSWLQLETRRFRWVQVYARLRRGITAEQSLAGLQPLYASLLREEAKDAAFAAASAETRSRFLEGRLTVESASRGRSGLRESVTRPLMILMAVACTVLLIVCANLANLFVVRGLARRRELALRAAVGATRGRLVRLLLVETLVLAAAGLALGLLMATWGARFLLGYFATPEQPLAVTAQPDVRVVGFAAGLAVVSALAAGLVSALRVAVADAAPVLKGSAVTLAGGRSRLQNTLVGAQVALSLLLLVGAGLFLRTLDNLLAVDPGFRTAKVLSFSVDLARSGYGGDSARAFFARLVDRISATPGVEAAGASFIPLLGGGGWGMGFTIEGYRPEPGEGAGSLCNAVSPGFFRAMGVPILAGREFDARDDRRSVQRDGWPYRVAVVNETFAERYFAGRSPLGRRIGIGEDPGTEMSIAIVGLVKDARYRGVREDPAPQVFFPYLQSNEVENVTVYVRTAAGVAAVLANLRREIAALDPGMALYDVATLEDRVDRSIVNERLIASLSSGLSAMATLLSVLGLYGVTAYTVTRRTREFGIRIALGALRSQVAGSVLRGAGALVAWGLGAGLVAAWGLGRYLESQLYGVQPADPATIAAAAVALGGVAAAAALIPALRAARVEPMTALRQE